MGTGEEILFRRRPVAAPGRVERSRRPDESGSFWAIAVTHDDLQHDSPLNLSTSTIARARESCSMLSLARMSWELDREFGTSSAIKLLTID